MIRIFVSNDLNEEYILNKDDNNFHHLNNVLKIKIGKQICIVNTNAKIYELVSNKSDNLIFKYIKDEDINPELKIKITLVAPLLKKDNFELVLQKATELGVYEFIGGFFTNSVIKIDNKKEEKKLKRYDDILLSAAMQSQRNIIPKLDGFKKIRDIDLSNYDLIICCYESRKEENILNLQKKIVISHNILIIVGPEGGITKEEIEYLKNNNTKIVSLGSRILRAETACISAVNLVSQIIEEV